MIFAEDAHRVQAYERFLCGWPMDRGAFAWEGALGAYRIWVHKHTKLGGQRMKADLETHGSGSDGVGA